MALVALSCSTADTNDTAVRTAPPTRAVAITIDDLPVISVVRRDIAFQREVTAGILSALRKHGAPAIGFVNEGKLRDSGASNHERVALLEQWLDAGMQLGNHTYSHPDLHRISLTEFQRNVTDGERVTRELLARRNGTPRWFRHPFLHTGRSVAVRDSLNAFLESHGYTVAPVTIDNYDYLFAAAYDRMLAKDDSAGATRVVAAYLSYMDTIFGFYEAQSRAHLGREIPQVLLLHANALNARSLDALLSQVERRGYRFAAIDSVMRDPVYRSLDQYTGADGITWIHRWAITNGVKGSAFAGEPLVPAWVEEAANQTR